MKKSPKFFICNICGNIVEMIEDKGPKVFCCGKKMEAIIENTKEASTEKHIPKVTLNEDVVKVEVGSVLHPMTQEHHIGWIYVVANNGIRRIGLEIDKDPIVEFKLNKDEKIEEVYAYCNLHGLWKIEI
ncbi:MAG: desulfoferrodoxin family protein [Romboutsia sp.]|uniref:desulfoferrodoxin family protein n=1 Tax=Romboutsia sp. TaxID=1965302 RepID=UPI003F3A39EB